MAITSNVRGGTTAAAVSDDDAQYTMDLVGQICTQVGPGVPGSSEERQDSLLGPAKF